MCYPSKTSSYDNDDKFTLIRENNIEKSIHIKEGVFFYSGPVSELISFLISISSYQIMFRNMADYEIIMTCDYSEIIKAKKEPVLFLEKRLGLDTESESMTIDGFTLDIINPQLLYNNMNDKEKEGINPPHISDSGHIKAEKATLTEIANFLTDTKNKVYYYKGEDNTTYNWDFRYKNNQLMQRELSSNYGVQLKRETLKLPVFIISPLLSY